MHPLQGASFLSTSLQGGILKPPALRVVDDLARHLYERPLKTNASGCHRPSQQGCLVPVCEHGHGGMRRHQW